LTLTIVNTTIIKVKLHTKIKIMLYKFNSEKLIFVKDWKLVKLFVVLILTFTIVSFQLGRRSGKIPTPPSEFEKELIIINANEVKDKFHKDKMVKELIRLNVKFPHIVMAQSIIETGHWESKIFKENNNLFGMKEARRRIHTSITTQYNHAYYDSWSESLYDYCFYQSRYLGTVKTEQEYFNYLSRSYAEAPNYISIIKRVIEKEKLVELFE